MTTAIVYYSQHHGNTKKLLDAIKAAAPSVVLIDVVGSPDTDLSSYDRIGFASGIYYTNFAKQIIAFADAHLPENKDIPESVMFFDTKSSSKPMLQAFCHNKGLSRESPVG